MLALAQIVFRLPRGHAISKTRQLPFRVVDTVRMKGSGDLPYDLLSPATHWPSYSRISASSEPAYLSQRGQMDGVRESARLTNAPFCYDLRFNERNRLATVRTEKSIVVPALLAHGGHPSIGIII